jgi:hypothetical protein
MALAKLNTTVTIHWINHRGCERDCDVEVSYTYDRDDLRIVETRTLGDCPLSDGEFDELVWEAVSENANAEYDEWLADYADWMEAA